MSKSGKSELNSEETRKMLISAIAEVAEAKVSALEKAINKKAPPIIHKDDLRIAIRSGSMQAAVELEKKQKKNGQPLDAKAAENFRKEIDNHVDGLLSDTPDLSGSKVQMVAKINDLRTNINRFREANGVDLIEKPKVQEPKLSSEKTWNAIVNEFAKRADEKVNAVGTLENDNISNTKGRLEKQLGNTFKEILEDEKFTKNLDPKTAEIFKNNSKELVDHIVTKTKDSQATNINGLIGDIKTEVNKFQVTPKDKILDWQKVADVCKSVKLDKLAEFCHEKHLEGLTKEVKANLSVKLANHPKGTTHDADHKLFTPDHNTKGR